MPKVPVSVPLVGEWHWGSPLVATSPHLSGRDRVMGRIGVEDHEFDTFGRIGSFVFAGHWPRRSGRKSDGGQTAKRLVATLDVSVPDRIEHLMPFIGAENDDLIVLGDIGEQAVGGGDDAEARVGARDGREFVDTSLDRREAGIVLAQRVSGNRKVDMVEPKLIDGGFGEMHMRDRGRIK